MLCSLSSFGLVGIEPFVVSVEVDKRVGLPGFDIVGLPDLAVKESRDRVKSALINMGYKFPDAKIVVNLAPADTKKTGSVYDLPILLALLSAAGYEQFDAKGLAVVGEIGLSGEIRGITGVLPMALRARDLGITRVIVPVQNAAEAAAADDITVLAASHARDVVDYLKGKKDLRVMKSAMDEKAAAQFPLDLSDVKGQAEARRAMEIAAAGGHNLLFIGPPGTGKSMLAKRLPSILPEMTRQESIETTILYSVAGQIPQDISLLTQRPFRSPHHTVSPAALIGGGLNVTPGDVPLAHNGVLFLDELPEFPKNTLEVLRQPLEDGFVNISRVRQRLCFPSRIMLVAAMNPCKCGYFGHPTKKCTCTPQSIAKYLGRISGPLLDRIDIQVEVLPVEYEQISSRDKGEGSAKVRDRIKAAREIAQNRFKGLDISCNAAITPDLLGEMCRLEPAAEKILKAAFERIGLSARGYDRILKVARSIADLDGETVIKSRHISEAIQFRTLDRKYWAG